MAEWGKGDPRWIVEERPDATNVNNWHWTEKNACQWSKDKLEELLSGFEIKDKIGNCIISEIEKIEGEASANNRKAKLIFFYEWTLNLKWKGTLTGSTKGVEGSIVIPNLSDENDAEEVDVNVTISTSGPEADTLKDLMRHLGTKLIREQLAKYIKSLKEDFTQGMILPKKENGTQNGDVSKSMKEVGVKLPVSNSTPDMKQLQIATKIDTQTYEYNQNFKCPPMELYNVLTLPELMRAFTNAPLKVESTVGGKFTLFDGQITGQFTELVPNKKIAQKWRFKTWPEGHHSLVTIQLKDEGDSTELTLKQSGIPSSEYEKTVEGWQRYYWEAIKRTFGFGAFLL
nr:EOG090X09QT [Eurycercus lamellatus]